MMKSVRLLVGSAFVAAALTAAPGHSRADAILSAASETDLPVGANTTYTTPTSGVWGLFLAPGGIAPAPAFYNNDQSTANLNIQLLDGQTYTIAGYFLSGGPGPVTLFFDGSSTPGISATGAVNSTYPGVNSFSAFGGPVVSVDGLNMISGSGSLSYDNGTSTVTLTDLQIYNSVAMTAAGAPNIDIFGTSPGTYVPEGFTVTLSVTNDSVSTPEPSSMLLLSTMGGFAAVARRRRSSRRV